MDVKKETDDNKIEKKSTHTKMKEIVTRKDELVIITY